MPSYHTFSFGRLCRSYCPTSVNADRFTSRLNQLTFPSCSWPSMAITGRDWFLSLQWLVGYVSVQRPSQMTLLLDVNYCYWAFVNVNHCHSQCRLSTSRVVVLEMRLNDEVCSRSVGHYFSILARTDPRRISTFWEGHWPRGKCTINLQTLITSYNF